VRSTCKSATVRLTSKHDKACLASRDKDDPIVRRLEEEAVSWSTTIGRTRRNAVMCGTPGDPARVGNRP
jgi:hypothetical protein